MNAAVIDTNVLIECFQNNQSISEAISQYDRILICPAVLGEFKAGIDVNTRRGKKVKALLDEFLDDPAVAIVPCTDETADYYARIFRTLKDNGTPLPTNDIWIAAAALEHGAAVLSSDVHFSHVPMLKLA
jgi:tRNA(fMet)-specific endonuclease VapC